MRVELRRAIVAVSITVGALALAGAAGARCGAGYSYAGLEGAVPAGGIAATVTALSRPRVRAGHVAAWVGVGGYGLGPHGTDEWLQAGIATRAGSTGHLYVEWKRPHRRSHYLELPGPVAAGVAHRVFVSERLDASGVWQAFVDGIPAGPAVALPASHGRFYPLVVAESWDGGQRVCNRFAYRFKQIAVASPVGAWASLRAAYELEDPGHRLVDRTPSGFTARAVG